MITAYFDASGSPDKTAVVTVGGLISAPEKWVSFADEWGECLKAFGVSSLHMRHYAHSTSEFASWWNDEPKRRRFLSSLMSVIERHIEHTVAATVLMNDYEQIDRSYRLSEFMRPYTLAASTCVSSILPWAKEVGYAVNDITYIFEKGDADQSDVRRCWDSLFPSYNLRPLFLKKVDKHPPSQACAPIRPFEAADLIAYENLKANITLQSKGGTAFFDELRTPVQRLSKLPGGNGWRFFDLSNLESTCDIYRVAKR